MPKPPADLPDCFDCRFDRRGHPCRNADGSLDVAALAQGYVIHGRRTNRQAQTDDFSWTFACMDEVVTAVPELAFRCILAALEVCGDDRDIAYLAAGPLEDLIIRHGPRVIDAIEETAARNERFRRLLSGIWGESRTHPEVWSRLQRVLRKGPWLDDDPRTPQGSPRKSRRNEH